MDYSTTKSTLMVEDLCKSYDSSLLGLCVTLVVIVACVTRPVCVCVCVCVCV